jgi:hypothetical protein
MWLMVPLLSKINTAGSVCNVVCPDNTITVTVGHGHGHSHGVFILATSGTCFGIPSVSAGKTNGSNGVHNHKDVGYAQQPEETLHTQ